MKRLVVILVVMAACKESGKAERVSPGTGSGATGPAPTWEPAAGDGPRCDQIAGRLAASAGGPRTATVEAGGSRTELHVDVGGAAADALRDVCRRDRWTRAQRDCAFAFDFGGDVIAGISQLRATCLGAVK